MVKSTQKVCIFLHPDYTVGFGIAPNQPLSGSQALTAGQESHPALKIIILYHYVIKVSILNVIFFLLSDGTDDKKDP